MPDPCDKMRPADPKAEFPALWVQAQPMVFSFILAVVHEFHQAEDVLQRVGLKAFEMRDRYDPNASKFSTWVIGIAQNEIKKTQHLSRRDRLVFDAKIFDAIAEAASGHEDRTSEVHDALRLCLREVEGRPRQILQMRYHDGMRSREIAHQLRTSEGVVNVSLHRVRAALYDCINRRLGEREVML